MTRTIQCALLAGAIALLFGSTADAQRGWGPGRGGWGPGRGGWGPGGVGWGGGPRLRCARMLLRAHPDLLKARLGLNDAQLARINKVRANFLNKRIAARAEIQKLRLQLRTLFQASDTPSEQKVLVLMRKVRARRGRLTEEGVKTHLRVIRTLTQQQRAQLRTQCQQMGWPGRRFGRGGPGMRRGGWGRGPGGWGPGGW